MRSGSELVRASQPYAQEDLTKTWVLFAQTFLAFSGLWVAIILAPYAWLQLALSVVLGLVGVRMFIFYHDYCHGAAFRKSRVGAALMGAVGFYTLAVPSVWRETHNYHHRNNAKLTGSWIGSYPTVSLRMYRVLKPAQRRQLRLIRHPLSMLGGLFTTFMIGMSIAPFQRDRAQHKLAPVALVVWWLVFGGLSWAVGVWTALMLWVLPTALHSALGSYLFYAQHNFPGVELKGRREWEFSHAALRCSSFFEMSPLMHWFTGNIGYHHVHHLNHRIPFYRLPEAMAEMPELADPIRTSWRPSDILACLNCSVWDAEAGRMVSFAEADAAAEQSKALAAK